MLKVNVANYIINDLSKRFPMQSETVVDKDIIDVVINEWSNRRYVVPGGISKERAKVPHNHLYLM